MRKKSVKIKLLDENAIVPTIAKHGDAGADLYSIESVIIHGRTQKLVRTGIALEIPYGYVGLIRPRSGLATKLGIGMNSSGVVDSGYRGEISVTLINHSDKSHNISPGQRIAQIVFVPYLVVDKFDVVDQLEESERGSGGYGSTGGWTA
jgi:dUTP pyrophosphatase